MADTNSPQPFCSDVEYPSTTFSPGDLLMATIEVTAKAFAVITGTPLETENPNNEDS